MIRPWEAWVDQGKRGGGVIPFSHPSDPGIWDIHRGSSMTSTLTTSSPRFSQILEYDPVNPDVVVGDLAASWEVNESWYRLYVQPPRREFPRREPGHG